MSAQVNMSMLQIIVSVQVKSILAVSEWCLTWTHHPEISVNHPHPTLRYIWNRWHELPPGSVYFSPHFRLKAGHNLVQAKSWMRHVRNSFWVLKRIPAWNLEQFFWEERKRTILSETHKLETTWIINGRLQSWKKPPLRYPKASLNKAEAKASVFCWDKWLQKGDVWTEPLKSPYLARFVTAGISIPSSTSMARRFLLMPSTQEDLLGRPSDAGYHLQPFWVDNCRSGGEAG